MATKLTIENSYNDAPDVFTAEQRFKTCVHEAAHCVIHALGGNLVYGVEVAPEGATDWVTENRNGGLHQDLWGVCRPDGINSLMFLIWSQEESCIVANKKAFNDSLRQFASFIPNYPAMLRRATRAYVCGCLAGPIASQILEGYATGDLYLEPSYHQGDDITQAMGLCQLLPYRNEFYHLTDETEAALRDPEVWGYVMRLAEAIQANGKIEFEELLEFLPEKRQKWLPSPRSKKK